MTEILTESFCERCGTRYTFETARPQNSRIGRARTLTKGLRNFVLSDDPLSVAMADARGEEERAATALQLDAFHKTFNFCLTCRQYTCSNCWNVEEGRCLSCSPRPDTVLVETVDAVDTAAIVDRLAAMTAPPALAPHEVIGVAAWPEADMLSHAPDEPSPAETASAESEVTQGELLDAATSEPVQFEAVAEPMEPMAPPAIDASAAESEPVDWATAAIPVELEAVKEAVAEPIAPEAVEPVELEAFEGADLDSAEAGVAAVAEPVTPEGVEAAAEESEPVEWATAAVPIELDSLAAAVAEPIAPEAVEPVELEAFEPVELEAAVAEPMAPEAVEPEAAEPVELELDSAEAGVAEPMAPEAVEPVELEAFEPVELEAAEAGVAEPMAPEAVEPEAFEPVEPEAVALDAAELTESDVEARTRPHLHGLKPGESLDHAIAAYEAALAARETEAATVVEQDSTETGPIAEGVIAQAIEAEPEPVAAATAAEQVAPAVEHLVVLEPEPAAIAELTAVGEPELEAVATAAEPELVGEVAEPAEAPAPATIPESAAVPEPVIAFAEPEPVAAAPQPEAVPEPAWTTAPEPVVAVEPEPEAVPEPAWTTAPEPEGEPEPVAAVAEAAFAAVPEPVFSPPEPVVASAPVPPPVAAPERVAASAPVPPAVPTSESMAPGWLTVAPDDGVGPVWPQRPTWSTTTRGPMEGTTLAGRRMMPSNDAAALWAASAREVLSIGPLAEHGATSVSPSATPGAQPCVGCGLPLSANARFCRRCGSRQG